MMIGLIWTAALHDSGQGEAEFKIKNVIKICDTKRIFISGRRVHICANPVSRFRPDKSGAIGRKKL
jgi:hypothetical protein